MSNSFNDQIRREIDRIKRRKKHNRMIASASAIIAVITMLASSMPATTATAKLLCGKEEHVHTEDCYETKKVLVCGHEKDGITKEEYAALAAKLPAVTSGDVMAEGAPAESRNAEAENKEEHVNVEPVSVPSDETTETTSADTTSSDSMGVSVDTSSQDASKNVSEESSQSGNSTAESSVTEDTGNSKQTEPVNLEESQKEENSSDSTNAADEEEQKKEEASSSSDTASETEASDKSSSEDHVVDGIDLDTVHVHTDSCYKEEKVLVCGKEEHKHTEACYEQGGSITGSKDDAAITITYDAGELEKGTDVIVDALSDDDQNTVRGRINDELAKHSSETEKKSVSAIYPYHITLMKDGETKTPEGLVDVSMQFANRRSSTDQNISWKLYYVTSDGIEDLTDDSHSQNDAKINTNDAGEVTDLSFKTDKFNIFVLAAVKTEAVEKAKEQKASGTLTAEADGAKATLKYEDSAVEEGTQLIISADSEKKASIQPLIEKSLKSSDSKQEKVAALYPYTLSLEKDGSTVQPAKEVEVTVDFTSALTTTAANGTWHVYHMDAAGQLEDVTEHADIQTDESGAVTQVRFMAASLSEYVIASIDTEDVKTVKDITLSAEKNGIQVTVKADSSVIEDGTELLLTDDKYAKSDIVSIIDKNLESENTIKEEKSAADVYPFGLSLVKDGKAVSPKGVVSVEVAFTEKAKSNVERGQWRVYRLKSKEDAKDITDSTIIHKDDSNAVDKISFETKTLSDYALVNVKTTEIKESTKKLTAKADGVSVSLSYKKGVLPEGTKLIVKEKASTEDAISSINTLIRKTAKRSYVVDNYMFSFDLTCDGKSVEPEGTVTVQIDFEKGLTAGKENAAWRVFHFKNDSSINEITEGDNSLNLISSGKVLNYIEFKTDSFSAYAVTSVASRLALMRAAANLSSLSLNNNDVEARVTNASFYVIRNGKEVDNPSDVNDGEELHLTLGYKIPKGVKLSDYNNQVTYQFDEHLKAISASSGTIYDKANSKKEVGIYSIDQNGLVTLKFTDPDYLDGSKEITGDFAYNAKAENSNTQSDHKFTIAGTGTTINIKARKEDLQVKKSSPVVSYTNDGKIKLHYTVEATSTTGTSSAVVFEDTPTFTGCDKVTISNPIAYYVGKDSTDYNENNKIQIVQAGSKIATGQALDSDHKIILVYDIVVDSSKISSSDGNFSISNKVIGTSGNTQSQESSSWYSHDNFISKTGSYKDNKIYWEIIVDKFVDGPITIADKPSDILNGIDLNSFKKYISKDGSSWNWDELTNDITPTFDKETGEYHITFSGDPGRYKISYYSELKDEFSRDADQTAKNTVTYNDHSANCDVSIPAEKLVMTKKDPTPSDFTTSDEKVVKKLTWTINIKLPSSSKYIDQSYTLSDYFTTVDSSSKAIANAHYSNAGIFDLSCSNGINGNDFSISYLDKSKNIINNVGTNNFYGFNITFTKEQLQNLRDNGIDNFNITYNTIADITNDAIGTFSKPIKYKNTADIGGPAQEKQYEYKDSGRILYKLSSFNLDANHTSWNITDSNIYKQNSEGSINIADPYVYYRIIVGVGTGTSDPVIITDTLPQELDASTVDITGKEYFQFSSYSGGVVTGQDEGSWNPCNFTVLWNSRNNTFTIAPNENEKYKDYYIAIYYKVRLSNSAINNFLLGNGSISFTNTASVDGNQSSSTAKANYKKLSKSAVYDSTDNNQTITYNLLVNPGSEALNDGNILTLKDILNENKGYISARFNEDYGVKFYSYDPRTNTKGNEIFGDHISEDYSYTYEDNNNGHQLTVKVPDKTALIISYQYNISASNTTDASISNNVTLTGGYSDNTSTRILTVDSGASAGINSGLTVYKIRSGHAEIKIPGVKFTLSQYSGTDWTPIYDQSNPLVTDASGKFEISVDGNQPIKESTLYKLTEIENNNIGYGSWSQGNINHYIVFVDNNDISKKNDEIWSTVLHPDSISVDGVTFVRRSQRLDISNNYTKLNIRKVWQDSDGKDISNDAEVSGNTVTVKLTRLRKLKSDEGSNYEADSNFGDNGVKQYTLEASNHWTVGITETDLNENSDYDYLYSIIEDPANISADYTISYKTLDNSGNFIDMKGSGIEEGTLVVINKKKSISYNLPSTGGDGSAPFVLTGFVMTSLAALMYIYRRHISGRGGAQ